MTEMLVQSMTSQLIVRFRDRILSGAYAPGSALRQDSLAAEFGTSKIPVREALVQLQSEGLVDIYPNRGFQVRPLASAELDEVFRLRLQIEPGAVACGAKLAGAADHAAARAALARLTEATAAGEFGSSGQLNRAFHLLLIVPRLQPVAAEILSRLHTLAQRYVQDKAIPSRFRNDALHVAIAVLNGLDVVVTWNMQHLANVRQIERINRTNRVMALSPVRIHTPEEVIDL